MTEWFVAHRDSFDGELRLNEPLAKHGWYRIGGPARVFCIPRSYDGLQWIRAGIQATGAQYAVIGAGSNLLVSDQGFDGVVIRTSRLNLDMSAKLAGSDDSPQGQWIIHVGASVMISTLLRRAALDGWAGLEFLTGIPGTVGGAVVMNAGTHLGESASRLESVHYVRMEATPGEKDSLIAERSELQYEYRRNLFLPADAIVYAADWRAEVGDPAAVKARIDETLERRKATQPIDMPSCGSVFKNPREQGMSAWQVIDRLGLRGHRIGGAEFSTKHCNFIVNTGGATAKDVRELIDLARRRAKDEMGVWLEEEVRYLGRFGD